MSERRQYRGLVWPIILILVGTALLLERMGVLAIEWREIWRLWPVGLILLGLDMLLGRTRLGSMLVLGVTALALVALVYVQPVSLGKSEIRVERYDMPLAGVERADVRMELGVGELQVHALEDSAQLFVAEAAYDPRRVRVSGNTDLHDGVASVLLSVSQIGWTPTPGSDVSVWNVELSPEASLALAFHGGVSSGDIDLSGLDVERVEVNAGVGDVNLWLSERGAYRVSVGGGVGEIRVYVPEERPARIRVSGGVGDVDLASRFVQSGRYYVTGDYVSTDDAIDVDIDGGIGDVLVR